MKKRNNVEGLAPLLVLLVVIIIALMCLAGWLIWEKIQNNQVETSNTSNNNLAITPRPVSDKKSIPAGYKEYINQEYGIKFVYPENWGNVSTSIEWEQSQGHLTSGKGIVLSFSGEDRVSAGIRSSNWVHNQNFGHGGVDSSSTFAPVGEAYNLKLLERENYQIVEDNGVNSIIALTPLCHEGGCSSMALVLINKLNKNSTTNGIAFVYSPKVEINIDPTIDEANMQQAINALPWAANFPVSLINQFKTINASIGNL